MRGHQGAVYAVIAARTKAGAQLFSASQDNTVRVWSLDRQSPCHLADLAGHLGFVRALAVSGGGALLCSGSQDRQVRVWDTMTHVQLCALSGHKLEIFSLAVHNDLLLSGSEDSTIRVWNIASLKCIKSLTGHSGAVFTLAICGSPPCLASGSRDHTVRLWDLATLELRTALAPPHHDSVICLASVGNRLFSGSRDRSIKHWDLEQEKCSSTQYNAHEDWVCALCASAAAGLLVSGGRDGRIKLWGLADMAPRGQLEGHAAAVNHLIFHEDALVSSSNDRTIRVWHKM